MMSDKEKEYYELLDNIRKYLERIQEICKILKIKMPMFGQQKLELCQEEFILKRHLNKLEQKLKTRQDNVIKLRLKELTICQLLGMEPRIINEDPLPSPTEIVEFEKHIEDLEQEKFKRQEQFLNIKEKLSQLIKEVDYVPNTEFERNVMLANESNFILTETNMESLKNFHSNMEKKLELARDEINQLTKKVEQLWTLLDLEFHEREDFRNKNTGYSLKVIESLQSELKRCEQVKQADIKVLIIKLRQDLEKIWKECHCSETIKNEFTYFHSDCFSENVLELHELQLKKWRTYSEENREILNLLNKHTRLWNKKLHLEETVNDREHYMNRGGKLLQDEKDRNMLAKQIPATEKKLMILAEKYEANYTVPFLTYGESIGSYINNLHATKENTKKLKMSKRKAQKDIALIPLSSNTQCSSRLRQEHKRK